MRKFLLPLTLAVTLAACSQPATPTTDHTVYGSAFQPGAYAGTPFGHASLMDGRRIWSDGRRIWSDGFSLWSDGRRIWSDGRRIWSDSTFQPAPDNTDAFKLIGLDRAQQRAPRLGEGVTVAIIDSGVDTRHPVLEGRVIGGYDYLLGRDGGREAAMDGDPAYGHGTAVASLVQQVAPNSRILSLRVIGPDGSGSDADVARAIRDAAARGARIINLSMSGASSGGIRDAIVEATGRGVLVVASSGNTGASSPESPASHLNLSDPTGQRGLSVSATDTNGTLTEWTNRGGEVNAPGVGLTVAYPQGRATFATGTSFSAPLVTGTLALALAEGANPADLTERLKRLTQDGLLNAAALIGTLN